MAVDPEALASVEDVQGRLPFEMSEEEEREAEGAITDLSDDARHYGSPLWSPTSCPRQVKNLVVKAAARHMKNYEGYVSSRAGDEAVAWSDRGEGAGSAEFTRREQKLLREMGTRPNLTSAPLSPWGTRDIVCADETVPAGNGQPFPFYAAEDEGW